MLRKTSLRLATIAGLGVVALLTGCAAESEAEPTTPESEAAEVEVTVDEADVAEEVAEDDAETEDASATDTDVSLGGDYSLTVDGVTVELENPIVGCTVSGDEITAGVATSVDAEYGTAGITAVFTTDPAEVTGVSIITTDGIGVTYAKDSGVGRVADLQIDGNTYRITGEGMVLDTDNPTAFEQAEFEFSITCD